MIGATAQAARLTSAPPSVAPYGDLMTAGDLRLMALQVEIIGMAGAFPAVR